MADSDIWFPFYPGDYLADTMRLTTEQHGAYLLLLICFWGAKGKMADDDHAFAAITRMGHDLWTKEMRPILAPFFQVDGGVWTHKRVVKERLRTEEIRKKRSESGKLGGRSPKQNESKMEANAKQNESKMEANAKQNESKMEANVKQNESMLHPHPHPHSESQPQPQPHLEDRCAVQKELKIALNALYERSAPSPWSYAEDCLLLEVARRPDAIAEMSALWHYRKKLPPERQKFFPQAVENLLTNWTKTLDRAKGHKPEFEAPKKPRTYTDGRTGNTVEELPDGNFMVNGQGPITPAGWKKIQDRGGIHVPNI